MCNQCTKSKRTCLGYRNLVDVVFRDVSKHVARMSNRSIGLPSPAEVSSSHSQSINSHPIYVESYVNRSVHVLPTVEDRAICYFLSNYALTPSLANISRGYLECLLPLYSSSLPNSALHATVAAVSMAAFGHRFNATLLLPQARRTYIKALSLVNIALRDPKQVKTDTTLMSVLLFSLYEVRQCSFAGSATRFHFVDDCSTDNSRFS